MNKSFLATLIITIVISLGWGWLRYATAETEHSLQWFLYNSCWMFCIGMIYNRLYWTRKFEELLNDE